MATQQKTEIKTLRTYGGSTYRARTRRSCARLHIRLEEDGVNTRRSHSAAGSDSDRVTSETLPMKSDVLRPKSGFPLFLVVFPKKTETLTRI